MSLRMQALLSVASLLIPFSVGFGLLLFLWSLEVFER
jgi:hypothetical protein